MKTQVLVDLFLDRQPASLSGIIFISAAQGGSLSKNEYYVN